MIANESTSRQTKHQEEYKYDTQQQTTFKTVYLKICLMENGYDLEPFNPK